LQDLELAGAGKPPGLDEGAEQMEKIKASKLPANISPIWILLISFAAAVMFAGGIVLCSARAGQWPFEPSGYFYPKEGLPADLEHITLLRNYKEGDEGPVPGVYTAQGEVYEFAALRAGGQPDYQKLFFEFTTITLNGISYKFTGEFLNSHIFEEYVTDPNEVVARGTLMKLKNEMILEEIPVQFTYSPKLRNLSSDVNAKYPSGKTELMWAALKRDIDKVRALLAKGADINARDPDGSTTLELAVKFFWGKDKREEELVSLLISAGADVNLANVLGDTPLMYATYTKGRLVNLLLKAGADVNARDKNGRTALIWAVQAVASGLCSIEDVKALIAAGADLDARDKFGRTALSIAEEGQNKEIVDILKRAAKK
jgi:ankyrin repeat protein